MLLKENIKNIKLMKLFKNNIEFNVIFISNIKHNYVNCVVRNNIKLNILLYILFVIIAFRIRREVYKRTESVALTLVSLCIHYCVRDAA